MQAYEIAFLEARRARARVARNKLADLADAFSGDDAEARTLRRLADLSLDDDKAMNNDGDGDDGSGGGGGDCIHEEVIAKQPVQLSINADMDECIAFLAALPPGDRTLRQGTHHVPSSNTISIAFEAYADKNALDTIAKVLTALSTLVEFRIVDITIECMTIMHAEWRADNDALLRTIRGIAPQYVFINCDTVPSLDALAGVPIVRCGRVGERALAKLRTYSETLVLGGAGDVFQSVLRQDDKEAVRELKNTPSSIRYRAWNGKTLAHDAVTARLLLFLDAVLHADPALANVRDSDGATPAHCARKIDYTRVVSPFQSDQLIIETLLEHGCDLSLVHDGRTAAAHLIAELGASAVYVIAKKAPELLRVENAKGRTPLVEALVAENFETALYIVRAGAVDLARINEPVYEGMTLLALAVTGTAPHSAIVDRNPREFIDLLCRYGADPTRRDASGYSAVGHALRRSNFEFAQQMLALCSADWISATVEFPPNSEPLTLIDVVLEKAMNGGRIGNAYNEMLVLLVKYGAVCSKHNQAALEQAIAAYTQRRNDETARAQAEYAECSARFLDRGLLGRA